MLKSVMELYEGAGVKREEAAVVYLTLRGTTHSQPSFYCQKLSFSAAGKAKGSTENLLFQIKWQH